MAVCEGGCLVGNDARDVTTRAWVRLLPVECHCWDVKGLEFGSFSGQICSVTGLLMAQEIRLRLQDQ